MLARSVRAFHSAARSAAAAAPAAAAGVAAELTVTISLPHKPLVAKREVKRVTMPGREGVMGVEKNSPPAVTELGPGVVRVDYMDNTSEEFFIPGGFSFKHANNTMDLSTTEGVKLDLVDVEALRSANAAAVKARDAATVGTKEHAEAKIALELYRTLAQTLKVTI